MNNLLEKKSYVFWIKGKEIHQCPSTHIRFVINNPELFNITKKEIIYYYKSFDEQLYTEGKARKIILNRLFKNGWNRARIKEQRTIIECENFELVKEDVFNFLKYCCAWNYIVLNIKPRIEHFIKIIESEGNTHYLRIVQKEHHIWGMDNTGIKKWIKY